MKLVDLTQKFVNAARRRWQSAAREARLIEKGLIHIGEADAQTREDFCCHAVTCAIETGLSAVEGVALEATIAVAMLETGEKIGQSPPDKISLREVATDMAISITSSALAAASAAANMVKDLEISGIEWESRHARAPSPCP